MSLKGVVCSIITHSHSSCLSRESLLTREIEDLKSKLVTKTNELNENIYKLEKLRRERMER